MWLIGYQTHIVNDFWAFVSIFKQWKQNESLTLNIRFHDFNGNILRISCFWCQFLRL
jgi:hypothetical protein